MTHNSRWAYHELIDNEQLKESWEIPINFQSSSPANTQQQFLHARLPSKNFSSKKTSQFASATAPKITSRLELTFILEQV